VRRLIWTFAMLFALSTVTAVWLWFGLRAERTRSLALEARLTQLERPHPTANRENTSPRSANRSASPASGPAIAALAQPTAAVRIYTPSADDELAHQRNLLRDPKYRDAWREEQRVLYARRRNNLVRVVGLTPEQADAVLDVQIDRELDWIENPAEVSEQRARAGELADQQRLRELLGEQKAQQLQTYMESRATRMRVDDFRSELAGADALRDDQVEPLIAALHVEDARLKKEMDEHRATLMQAGDDLDARRKLDDQQIETLKAGYERMHSAAAPVLNSSQLDKFDAMLKRDLDRRSAAQRVNRISTQVDRPDTSPIKSGSE